MNQWNWISKDSAVLEIFSSHEVAMVAGIRRVGDRWRARVEVAGDIASLVDGCYSPKQAARIALNEAVRVADDMLTAARSAVGTKLPPIPEEVKP